MSIQQPKAVKLHDNISAAHPVLGCPRQAAHGNKPATTLPTGLGAQHLVLRGPGAVGEHPPQQQSISSSRAGTGGCTLMSSAADQKQDQYRTLLRNQLHAEVTELTLTRSRSKPDPIDFHFPSKGRESGGDQQCQDQKTNLVGGLVIILHLISMFLIPQRFRAFLGPHA